MYNNTTIDNRAETNSFKFFKYSFHFLSITAEICPDKLGKEAQQQRHGWLGLQDGRRLWMKHLKRINSSSAVNPRKTQPLGTRFDKRSLGKSNAKTAQWWLLCIRDSALVKYSQKSEKLKQLRSLTLIFPVFVWKCYILELSCWREFDPTGCVGLIEIAQRGKPFSTPLHDTD